MYCASSVYGFRDHQPECVVVEGVAFHAIIAILRQFIVSQALQAVVVIPSPLSLKGSKIYQ